LCELGEYNEYYDIDLLKAVLMSESQGETIDISVVKNEPYYTTFRKRFPEEQYFSSIYDINEMKN